MEDVASPVMIFVALKLYLSHWMIGNVFIKCLNKTHCQERLCVCYKVQIIKINNKLLTAGWKCGRNLIKTVASKRYFFNEEIST